MSDDRLRRRRRREGYSIGRAVDGGVRGDSAERGVGADFCEVSVVGPVSWNWTGERSRRLAGC